MSGKNKIGIEVQVEFPTIADLQSKLADKWKSVKKNFKGKINVDVDEQSLASMKAKIRKALKEDSFNLKVDIGFEDALKDIDKIYDRLKDLDQQINKTREIKIGFDMSSMDKSMRDVIAASQKAEDNIKSQEKAVSGVNQELNKSVKNYDKIQKISKQLQDGTYAITTKTTYKNDDGNSVTLTQKPNGNVDESVTNNRKQDLKEIEESMKRIHALEMQAMDADRESLVLIQKQLREERAHRDILKDNYYLKHNMSSSSEDSTKALAGQQEMKKALKEQTLFAKAVKEEENEIANAIARNAQLEQKKQQIAKQLVSAKEDEREVLSRQFTHYEKAQQSLEEQYKISKNMTTAQREELKNIQMIGSLETERASAKKVQQERDRQLSQAEKARYQEEQARNRDVLNDLKQIHKMEQQILQIKSKDKRSTTDESRLRVTQEELRMEKEKLQEAMRFYRQEGLITSELEEQMNVMAQINRVEKERIERLSRVENMQSKANDEMNEYKRLTQDISQLQRDLVFAGMREQNVIEKQISSLEQKRSAIRDSLKSQDMLTNAVEEEVRAIEKAQAEQRQLNRLRQDAREKDQSFNDTGGLVDPFSFANHVEQGARTVLESVARIDEALIGVEKVANATQEQFEEFAKTSYDTASSLGVTADEYVLAVEKWVTAGKSFSESQELAKTSLVGAFVGNISADEMVSYMSVPLLAFKDEMLTANDIINTMNEVSNNYAAEMPELGKAFMRSAVTAKDAGVSFGELTGMITGAQEATRKGGEKIGTGIKSIALNISNMSAKLSGTNANRYEWFENIGVNINDANGEMRSMTDVLRDLSSVWGSLSDSEKGTAKYFLAGKEHAETLGAIIDQWDKVEEIGGIDGMAEQQKGLEEAGSAYIEHAKQADSVKFKLAELKNTFDELMYTAGGGRNGVSMVLDAIIQGLKTVNSLLSNEHFMDTMKVILAGVSLHASTNAFKRFFDTVATGLGNIRRDATEVRSLFKDLTGKGGGSNDKNNNKDNDKNSNSNGSTVISTTRSEKRNKKRKKGRNKGNAATDNDHKSTLKDVDKTADKVNGKLSKTGKLVGKVAGLLPIVGDIFLLMELTGVPVLETVGKMFDKMTTSAEKTRDKIDKTHKKILATNSITNGTAASHDGEVEKLDKSFKEKMEDKKTPGYMSPEEFLEFQQQFNEFADSANLDIKIDMNDTAHIEEKIKELKEALAELKKEELMKLGNEGFKESKKNRSEAKDKKAEAQAFLKEDEAKIDNVNKQLEVYNKKKSEGNKLTSTEIEQYTTLEGKLAMLESSKKNNLKIIEESDKVIDQSNKNMQEYTKKLVEYGGSFEGLDHESLTEALAIMSDDYEDLTNKGNLLNDAQNKLNNSVAITDEEWRNLQTQFPALKKFNTDDANGKEEIVKKIQEVIEEEQDKVDADKEATRAAIEGASEELGSKAQIEEATGRVTQANEKLKGELEEVREEANKEIKDKEITWWIRLEKAASDLWKFLTGDSTTSTVEVPVKPKGDGHVSTGVGSAVGGISSANVSTGASAITSPTEVESLNKARKASSTDASSNSKVSQDIWRYWGKEMYDIGGVEKSLNDLTTSINNAKDNQDKLIKLYQQQQTLMRQQIKNHQSLYNAKNSEIKEVLNNLRKRGFKVDNKSNKILNLDYAKNLKGKQAEEAEQLLNTWKSLYTEMEGIQSTIAGLNQSILDTAEDIKDAKIARELKAYEKALKRINALITSINNKDTIKEKQLEYIGENDKEKMLLTTEKHLNSSKASISSLIAEFNKLSLSNIQYAENGTELQSTLEKLGSEILNQADAVIKYQESLNDLELSRVTDDLNKFNEAIDSNTSKISNNIDNLKEGLLSGTSLSNLQSSQSSLLDLNRDNKYDKLYSDRIFLEIRIQEALDAFAKKNVEREKNIANAQLTITASKYQEMLKMQTEYINGGKASVSQIKAEFGDLFNIGSVDNGYTFVKELDDSFKELKEKQDALVKKFEEDTAKAINSDEKELLKNQYIIDNLKLQEEYFKASVEGSKKAIKDLEAQLNDSALNDTQRNKIKEQISSYEKEIIDSQNAIKESIKDRFEFEFSLIEEAINSYEKFTNELEYALDVLDAIGGSNFDTKGTILEELMKVEKSKNSQILSTIDSLEKQLNLYEKGSFEWKLINEQLKEYKQQLKDSNLELLEMNKTLMSNSFSGTLNSIEKELFGGKTLDQLKDYQELWMEGLEREIALEKMYQRLADLGTNIFDEKMALLDKQEKLSKFEMEYLNKQLDVLELQQKLENLSKEKTVQTYKQKEDGTWDFVYEADSSQIQETQEELNNAKLELEKLKQQGQEEYLEKLEGILEKAEKGEYENIQEFKDAIGNLSDAFDSIVGDFPQIKDEYLQELIDAYSKFITERGGILDNIGINGSLQSPVYEGFSNEVVKAFDKIGSKMAETFANTLISRIPAFKSGSVSANTETGKFISINLDKVEFPNIQTADGIKEAILSLPQIALQKSKEKL